MYNKKLTFGEELSSRPTVSEPLLFLLFFNDFPNIYIKIYIREEKKIKF